MNQHTSHKIDEISITRPLKLATDQVKVAKILRDKSWQILGMGLEAVVAEHPRKQYVLKVYPAHSKYDHFVDFAHTVTSPHVPKFGRSSRAIPGTDWRYVRMEKLGKVTEQDLLGSYLSHMIALLAMEDLTGTNMMTPFVRDMVEEALHNMGFDVPDLMDSTLAAKIYDQMGGAPPESWQHVIGKLERYNQRKVGLTSWDLHEDNFMRRGNTLVIVDPFV